MRLVIAPQVTKANIVQNTALQRRPTRRLHAVAVIRNATPRHRSDNKYGGYSKGHRREKAQNDKGKRKTLTIDEGNAALQTSRAVTNPKPELRDENSPLIFVPLLRFH